MRVGLGFDSHRFTEGRPLVLGGVRIPHQQGLSGHSDADVLLHAICDGLLGAAGLPCIGEVFPDTDPGYKDADSIQLLAQVISMVKGKGYRVLNLDCTILAQEPHLVPYRDSMQNRIAGVLDIPAECITIKPKSGEGMGLVGRKEGMAALAVVLLDQE